MNTELIQKKHEELKNTPSDINQHLETLKKYASECDHVTEFGVRWVVSTWSLAAGNPKKLISYDTNYHENISLVSKTMGENFVFVQKNVLETKIEKTDLLFIDTYHCYDQLRSELELHADSVGKYIILHDTKSFGVRGEDGGEGILRAINEFLEVNPNWGKKEEFVNNNGLMVLVRVSNDKNINTVLAKHIKKQSSGKISDTMSFLIPLPDTPYYLWQMLVQMTNFRELGLEEETYYLIGYGGEPSPLLKKILSYRGLKAKVLLIKDERNPEHQKYGATMKPYLVKKFMEHNPRFMNSVFFYTDPDVVFTKKIDFSKYLSNDNTWYLSDTRSYLDSRYIRSKGESLFTELCNIAGVKPRLVQMNDMNAGGAQWIIKYGDAYMWDEIESVSYKLWDYMTKTASYYHPQGDPYPVQAWVAEMLATIWIPWAYGVKTIIDDKLSFAWANHNIESWERNSIYHNAGVPAEDGINFCKVTYQQSPFNKNINVSEKSASYKYVDIIKKTEQVFSDITW